MMNKRLRVWQKQEKSAKIYLYSFDKLKRTKISKNQNLITFLSFLDVYEHILIKSTWSIKQFMNYRIFEKMSVRQVWTIFHHGSRYVVASLIWALNLTRLSQVNAIGLFILENGYIYQKHPFGESIKLKGFWTGLTTHLISARLWLWRVGQVKNWVYFQVFFFPSMQTQNCHWSSFWIQDTYL